MAIEPVPPLTPAPLPAPQRGDRATFSPRVDAFVTWLTAAVTQFYDVSLNAKHNAEEAEASALAAADSEATASAAAASTAAGVDAAQWSAPTAYAQYAPVFSVLDGATYRRRTAGTSSLDPAKDYLGVSANWWRVSGPSEEDLIAISFYN